MNTCAANALHMCTNAYHDKHTCYVLIYLDDIFSCFDNCENISKCFFLQYSKCLIQGESTKTLLKVLIVCLMKNCSSIHVFAIINKRDIVETKQIKKQPLIVLKTTNNIRKQFYSNNLFTCVKIAHFHLRQKQKNMTTKVD